MVIFTLQQIIDERISFLKEQINPENQPEVNTTFQVQIDAIRSAADDMEKAESILMQKKDVLKNSKDVHESERLLQNLTAWNGCNVKYQDTLEYNQEAATYFIMLLL
jgi:hypothetical protein